MNAVEKGIYDLLKANSALTTELGSAAIYNRHVPQATALPYVIFFHAGGGHENLNPSDLQNHVYLVKALAAEPKKAGTIHEKVVAALHQATLTVAGYANFYTALEDEVQITETTREGQIIYHTGGYYRIRIDA